MVKGKNQQSTFCKKRADDCILLYYGFYFVEIENTILNSCSLKVWVEKGCQQGGLLSPLLLFLLVDNLLAWLNWVEGGVYAQGYVDDICILGTESFPGTVPGLVQEALRRLEEW